MTTSLRSTGRCIALLVSALPVFSLLACGGSPTSAKTPASTLGAVGTTLSPATPIASTSPSSSAGSLVTTGATKTTSIAPTSPSSTSRTSAAALNATPTPKAQPWFVARRADGTLEAWAKDGKRVAVKTCANSLDYDANCQVGGVAASSSALWYVVHERTKGSTLYRAALDGDAPVAMQHASVEESYQAPAVSRDDRTVWFTHTFPGDSPARLERLRDGAVSTVEGSRGAVSVAASPDGRRLAFSVLAFGSSADASAVSSPTSASRVVIVDISSGTARTIDVGTQQSVPFAIENLSWSPDNRHLLLARSYEGRAMHVLDADGAVSATDPATPMAGITVVTDRGPIDVQQACWASAKTLALGTWYWPYAEGSLEGGDIVRYDVGSGTTTSVGVKVFGQGYDVGGMACRDDGAVAVVDSTKVEPADLKVIRADGTITRLGHNYLSVAQV